MSNGQWRPRNCQTVGILIDQRQLPYVTNSSRKRHSRQIENVTIFVCVFIRSQYTVNII
jgi:hypothetical protein